MFTSTIYIDTSIKTFTDANGTIQPFSGIIHLVNNNFGSALTWDSSYIKSNDNKNHKEIWKGEVIEYVIASEGLVTIRWDDNTIDDVVLHKKIFQKPYFDDWLIEQVIKYF